MAALPAAKHFAPQALRSCPQHAIVSQDEYGRELSTPPQDRVAAVRPFWESMSDQQRAELLSVTLPELQERAKEIAVRQRKQAGVPATWIWQQS